MAGPRLCLVCFLCRYRYSSITVYVLPPPGVLFGWRAEYLLISEGEISSYRVYGYGELERLAQDISDSLYEPDPVDYEATIILEETEYCEFREVLRTTGIEDRDAAKKAAMQIISRYLY